jgi:peroxiredoxin
LARRAPALAAAVAWLLWIAGATPGGSGADESRFLPWKGAATPALELHDLSGRPHALADYRGQVVLINFWATWCEFCKDEVASMKKLQDQLAGRPLAILFVNYGESPSKVRAYAAHLSADARVLRDPDREAARAWRVRVIPSSFLVDAEGRVRYSVIGNLDWATEESVKTVRALLP